MNYNNILILENYQVLLEKALFDEYIKEANKSQTLKSKFSELDTKVPAGYKYLNNPSKEDEVKILKQISRSDTFKKAALGAGIGAAAGLGSGLLLKKFKFNKDAEDKAYSARKQKYEGERKSYVNSVVDLNNTNFLSGNKDKDSLDLRKKKASHMKSLRNKVNSTSKDYENLRKMSPIAGAGAGAGAGLASGLALAKILAKNTKHVTLAGRKVYAIISKDEKTVYNLALPYSNGSKIIVKFIKASMSSL